MSAETTTNVSTGVFTHVAASFDPTGATAADKIKIYLNGALAAVTLDPGSTAITSIFDSTAALQIGAYQNGTAGHFVGLIDEVELFNVVLTPAQVLDIYSADAGGKCKPSDLKVTKTHTGNFLQNSTGNDYTITVTNDGPTTTSGVVNVLDSLPAGLTATGWSGTGWSCSPIGGGVPGPASLTCSRSNGLAAGASYEPIMLTVSTVNAAESVTNTATVSDGGEMDTSDDLRVHRNECSDFPGRAVSLLLIDHRP